jgi:hypothetical protein
MNGSTATPPSEKEILGDAINAFRIYSGTVLLAFAAEGKTLREAIARNFLARGMSCTQSIFAAWAAGREQDAWILFRALIDRLVHLHYLDKTDGFSDFFEYSFVKMYEGRHQLLCDPDMRVKVTASLKNQQKADEEKYRLLSKKEPRWHRPNPEDVLKEMNLGFIYRFGYDYGSMHMHPMSGDGESDFTRLTTPDGAVILPDATVVRNSILLQSMLVQEALNISKMLWHSGVYDFLDHVGKFLITGNQQFRVTLDDILLTWRHSKLCEKPTAADEEIPQ